MAVRKDEKSGKWLVDIWIGLHRVRKLMPDKRTAELYEKKKKVEEAQEKHLDIKPIKPVTFEAFSVDYLKYVETNLSAGRYRGVESTVRATLVPFFGPHYLKDITLKVVEDFKAEQARTHKASTINEYLNILRAMFGLAVKWGNVRENPIKGIKLLRLDATEPPALSVEESNRLLDACREDRDLYTFTAIGLYTGLRIGEALNLTWADVDLRRGLVKVRPKAEAEGVRAWRVKTGDLRDIPVNDFLAGVLARHPRHIASPYVLHHPDGRPTSVTSCGRRSRGPERGPGCPSTFTPTCYAIRSGRRWQPMGLTWWRFNG